MMMFLAILARDCYVGKRLLCKQETKAFREDGESRVTHSLQTMVVTEASLDVLRQGSLDTCAVSCRVRPRMCRCICT